MPPNVTSLIQPMGQGVIESMKRHYKYLFLQNLLFEYSNDSSATVNFTKNWKLSDTMFLVVSDWNCVTQETLFKAWKNLLFSEFTTNSPNVATEEILETLNHIEGSKAF